MALTYPGKCVSASKLNNVSKFCRDGGKQKMNRHVGKVDLNTYAKINWPGQGRQEFQCTLEELRVHAEGATLWAGTSAQLRGVSIQGDTLLRLIVNGPPSWADFDVFVA
ncbi:hypothetical protein ACROYT_G014543 [Oculina patagonica]